MNLFDLIGTDKVIKTNGSKKITINGKTSLYPVYKIKLDLLYYNDQNDRIATWISQLGEINQKYDEEYNNLIQGFICESNPEAIKKTKNNIRIVDQREPGVVLCDGRVIDGNRRFTCLRLISQEDKNDNIYFESVILDTTIERDRKNIKMLEIAIQHGEEQRVDYNLVDFAVGTYRDIVINKILSIEDYARCSNEPQSEIKKRIEVVKLFDDFLNYIHCPNKYHIIRELNLYSIFYEFVPILKIIENDEVETIKNSIFNNICFESEPDHRKYIRDLKKLIMFKNYDAFLNREREISVKAKKIIDSANIQNSIDIKNTTKNCDDIRENLVNSLQKALINSKKIKSKEKPMDIIDKSTEDLLDIDVEVIDILDDNSKKTIGNKINKMQKVLNFLDNKVNNKSNNVEQVKYEEKVVIKKAVENKSYFIRPKDINEPILMVLNNNESISGVLNVFRFKLISKENISSEKVFQIFLLDKTFKAISNVATLKILDEGSAKIELKTSIKHDQIYLCVKSEACKENEVDYLFNLNLNLNFDSDFIF